MRRPWRGATLEVTIERDASLGEGEVVAAIGARTLPGALLPPPELTAGTVVPVSVRFA
jgi:hypothetical protein